MKNNKYLLYTIELARKSLKYGDVPIAAIIVKNNKIIAKSYNKKEKIHDATAHAELIVIKKACKKLKTWHLEDCILYTTMEPCTMCTGAIIQSRIQNIYYCLSNSKFGNLENNSYFKKNKYNINKIDDLEYLNLIQSFFKSKR